MNKKVSSPQAPTVVDEDDQSNEIINSLRLDKFKQELKGKIFGHD